MRSTPLRSVATAGLVTAQAAPPPVTTEANPWAYSLANDPRAGLPVPSVWKFRVEGTVEQGSESIPFAHAVGC